MKRFYAMGIQILLLYSLQVSVYASSNLNSTHLPYSKSKTYTDDPCNQPYNQITLSSQAAVDAFPSSYHCTSVCSILISGNDITNVDSLYTLRSLGNLFVTDNPVLTSLSGLSGLLEITGDCCSCARAGLTISGNTMLSNLNGFTSLQSMGGAIFIGSNAALTNVDGLSALTSIGGSSVTSESLIITDNPSLQNINGFSGITTIPGLLRIENNTSLINIDGLASVSTIKSGHGRLMGLIISNNPALLNINGLSSLTKIGPSFGATLVIENNPLITNVDGLLSLTEIGGGYSGGLRISNNASLINVNGLSSLLFIRAANSTLVVNDNHQLSEGCGLFPLLIHGGVGYMCDGKSHCSAVTISGNAPGFTEENILAGYPCTDPEPTSQPTDLVFTKVTDTGINASFKGVTGFVKGYIVLLKALSPSAPEEVPVDGTAYSVGDVIGSSSIVVYNGYNNFTTSFIVNGLMPNTTYYFDVFSYNFHYNYLTTTPLEGSRTTLPLIDIPSTLAFSNVTDTTMTVSFGEGEVPGSYVALMKAASPSYPNDYPTNGYLYHVGNVIGTSSIVVHTGNESSFSVSGLIPNTTYYFDIFTFHSDSYTYDSTPIEGSQATSSGAMFARSASPTESLKPYPNPFDDRTTIPFYVGEEKEEVQIIIYDFIGRKVTDIVSQSFESGYHEASWNGYDNEGKRVTQGVYVYSITTTKGKTPLKGRLMVK